MNISELVGMSADWSLQSPVPHQNPNVMHIQTIRKHQREQGYSEMQHLIETGLAWKMEGTIGRSAMDLLRAGACFLPKESHRDYYGNRIPSRDDVKKGTMGSLQKSIEFFTENQW